MSASSTSPAQLRRFVNVFVADEDIRFLQNLDTPLTDGQVVSIVPAVAGGIGGRTRSDGVWSGERRTTVSWAASHDHVVED